jgi:hypothetical protein
MVESDGQNSRAQPALPLAAADALPPSAPRRALPQGASLRHKLLEEPAAQEGFRFRAITDRKSAK